MQQLAVSDTTLTVRVITDSSKKIGDLVRFELLRGHDTATQYM